ncbi:MAG: methyltransferase domain-containing protein [Limnochordia bacterium]|nr:methyltransferase domain-containing protein [Limnochordia bacterium]
MDEVVSHYDALIDENNDPAHDVVLLREYMGKWDGQVFIDELRLSSAKTVLEIGVGTGRLALDVCGKCKSFTGIDISPKTIERAKKNLKGFEYTELICADFLAHDFSSTFDVIYSSLTFMHIQDKQRAIREVAKLLNPKGRFVLSTSKSQERVLVCGHRRIPLFPASADEVKRYVQRSGLEIEKRLETEFAWILVALHTGVPDNAPGIPPRFPSDHTWGKTPILK